MSIFRPKRGRAVINPETVQADIAEARQTRAAAEATRLLVEPSVAALNERRVNNGFGGALGLSFWPIQHDESAQKPRHA